LAQQARDPIRQIIIVFGQQQTHEDALAEIF